MQRARRKRRKRELTLQQEKLLLNIYCIAVMLVIVTLAIGFLFLMGLLFEYISREVSMVTIFIVGIIVIMIIGYLSI